MSAEKILLVLPDPAGFLDTSSSENTVLDHDYASAEINDENKDISPIKNCRSSFFNRFERDQTKRAVLIKKTVSPGSKRIYRKAFGKNIENCRPIQCGSPHSKGNSPQSVSTPGKTKLYLRKEYSGYSLYDDKAKLHNEIAGEKLKEFLTALFEGVTEIENLIEMDSSLTETKQIVVMTQQIKEANAKKTRVNGKKVRNPTQQKVMSKDPSKVFSATEIIDKYFQPEQIAKTCEKLKYSDAEKADALIQFSNISGEILHLGADFASSGNDAQKRENFAFGTEEANSQMMIVEELKRRALKRGETVTTETVTKRFKFYIAYEIIQIQKYSSGITEYYIINPFTRQKPSSWIFDCKEVERKAKKLRLDEKLALGSKTAETSKEEDLNMVDINAAKSNSEDLFAGFSIFSPKTTTMMPSSSTTTTSDITMEDGKEKDYIPKPGAVGSVFPLPIV